MTDAEAAICSRLKQIRERSDWSQEALACELGISRDKLASVEYGRTPLRYDLARRICDQLNISIVWLAAGYGLPDVPLQIADELHSVIPPKLLLSDAFETFISRKLSILQRELLEKGPIKGVAVEFHMPIGLPIERFREWMLLQEIRNVIKRLPVSLCGGFMQDVTKAISDFGVKHGLNLGTSLIPKEGKTYADIVRKENLLLTKSATCINPMPIVKPQWPALKQRLQKASAKAGGKSALAKFLGVDLSRVSQWLSDSKKTTREPGAEYALQMLKWVEQQERR